MKKETKFEDNLAELEKIVNELENGEIDLDSAIEKYTKAMHLVKECDDKLKRVEAQVNKMLNENGELEDFEVEN